MQDWYQVPALILTTLLLPAFGRLYLRSRDTRTLLWFVAFVFIILRMALLYPLGAWDFNDGTHPWRAAVGQSCALLASGLILGSLSPLSFWWGRVRILYVIPFISPMIVYAILTYGIFHNHAPRGPQFLIFPDQRMVVAVTTNLSDASVGPIAKEVAKLFDATEAVGAP